ncbi:MAG: DUF255 domain-containing protein [Candidatus Sedimenticola endophacoides]
MNGNRLAHCTSPYPRQHAANPVHWHPWDAVALALALARKRDQPILLSIGYSACHWCHVMTHESFEDPATAELMNRHFINIKVDREERPDLDRIYQSAHQLLTGRPGGWPLTLFLTPDDQTPFFAGTYFPRESRHGLPPFRDVLRGIAHALDDQQQMIQDQNRGLMQALRNLAPRPGPDLPDFNTAPLENARLQLARGFDETHGGFGQAPKFPLPTHLARLLHHWATTRIDGSDDPRALHIVEHSLRQMARGGFNDQLGGGFYRYSVDTQWMIPHFEKMLYDNAQLLGLYSDLAQAGGTQLFADTARATADWVWVIRDMQSPEGGYHAALDADSADGEGGLLSVGPGGGTGAARRGNVSSAGRPVRPGRPAQLRAALAPAPDPRADATGGARIASAGGGACGAPGGPRATPTPGPRREDPHRLERPDDPRHGPGRTLAGGAPLHRLGAAPWSTSAVNCGATDAYSPARDRKR